MVDKEVLPFKPVVPTSELPPTVTALTFEQQRELLLIQCQTEIEKICLEQETETRRIQAEQKTEASRQNLERQQIQVEQ